MTSAAKEPGEYAAVTSGISAGASAVGGVSPVGASGRRALLRSRGRRDDGSERLIVEGNDVIVIVFLQRMLYFDALRSL